MSFLREFAAASVFWLRRRLGRPLTGRCVCVASLALMMGGCAEDLDVQPQPLVGVQALFDPGLRLLPTPTDLAINRQTGLLEVPVADMQAQPAQAAFDRYLNTLDGYPVAATAAFCLSGEVDGTTLGGAIKVIALPSEQGAAPQDISDSVSIEDPLLSMSCPVLNGTRCDPSAASPDCGDGQRCVALSATNPALGECADAGYRVVVRRAEPWGRGASYALFVTDALTDPQGHSVIRAPGFELVSASGPLCEFDETSGLCTYNYSSLLESSVAEQLRREQPDLSAEDFELALREQVLASGAQLEPLRRGMGQLLQLTEALLGLAKEHVALAWSFSTTSQTEAVFDPALGIIPGPANDLLLGADGKINIPPSPGETATEEALRLGLNTLEGFSTTATHFTTFVGTLDADTVRAGAELMLIKLGESPELVEPAPQFVYDAANGAVTMTPSAPLAEKTRYAVLLLSKRSTTQTGADAEALTVASGGGLADEGGRRVVASPTFALARAPGPLVDGDGSSLVDVLSKEQAGQLEPVRASYDQLLSGLEQAIGLDREDVVLLWTFLTQPITEPLVGLRALTYGKLSAGETPPGGVHPLLVNDPSKNVVPATCHPACWPTPSPPQAVATFVAGAAFHSWNALDAQTGLLVPDPAGSTAPVVETVPLYLAIPKPAACLPDDSCAPALAASGFTCATDETPKVCRPQNGWPVVVFQHGLRASRGQWFAVADTLASFGFASVAFDIVYHGDRSACSTDEQCINPDSGGPAAVCDSGAPRRCCVGEGEAKQCGAQFLRRDDDGIPLASGEAFLNAANPFALKSNMLQHVIDSLALLRALNHDAEAGLRAGESTPLGVELDETRVHFIGHSLGAILGTLVLAVDPLNQGEGPKRALLNVPGAPVVRIFEQTQYPDFQAVVASLLEALGVEPGSLDALRLFHILQWVVDPVDPANFAAYVKDRQLPDALSPGQDVPAKQLLFQLATGDVVIPGTLQAALADWMGADVSQSSFESVNHIFLLRPRTETPAADPAGLQAAAQIQMGTFLTTGAVCTPDVQLGSCEVGGSNE